MQRINQIINSASGLGDGLKNIQDGVNWAVNKWFKPDTEPERKEQIFLRTEVVHKGDSVHTRVYDNGYSFFKADTLRNVYSDSLGENFVDFRYRTKSGWK